APLLRPLGAVFRPALATILDALGIEGAANDVVAHAGQVLDASAADQHHRVLLQIVTLARDVARHLEGVGEPHARDLAQRGVRLLRRRRVDARADAALLRAFLKRRHLVARRLRHPPEADQLIDRRHPSRTLVKPALKDVNRTGCSGHRRRSWNFPDKRAVACGAEPLTYSSNQTASRMATLPPAPRKCADTSVEPGARQAGWRAGGGENAGRADRAARQRKRGRQAAPFETLEAAP